MTTTWTKPGTGATVAALLAMCAEVVANWRDYRPARTDALRLANKTLFHFTPLVTPLILAERTSLALLDGTTDAKDTDRAFVAIERIVTGDNN